jgi:nitrite reductase/ring-hydroxylating ferredoxin subunit
MKWKESEMEIKIASTKDVKAGSMIGVVARGQQLLLANVAGKYYAIGDICMHQGCTLSEGTLEGDKVECPCHGSTYDLKTGKFVRGPTTKGEPSYPVTIKGSDIFVAI